MQVNLKTVLRDYDGKTALQFVDGKSIDGKPVVIDFTLGDAIMQILNVGAERGEEQKTTLKRFRMSMQIQAALDNDGEKVFTAQEITFILDSMKNVGISVAAKGRIIEILDPDMLKEE